MAADDASQDLHSLYSNNHGWLQGWLRRRLGNGGDAADVAHDTFLRLLVTGNRPNADQSRAHLTQIANGLVVDLHRRRALEAAYLDALAGLPEDLAPSPEERALALEALLRLDAALSTLRPKARDAFLLSQLDGLTYADIAARLEISVAAVRKYMLRAGQVCHAALTDAQLDAVRHPAAAQTLRSAPPRRPPRAARRALLGLLVGGGIGAYALRQTPQWQYSVADHRTARGERRQLTLADGTRIMLGSASAIDVRYSPQARQVRLLAGEIFIVTASDHARPFTVQTAQGTVRALGTRFSVREADEGIRVAVEQGAVEIRPAAGAPAVRLDAGQQSRFNRAGADAARPLDANAMAWTRGLLVAERMPLSDFLAEVSRYRRGVLRADPAVRALVVSGVYPLDDTEQILDTLPQSLPVTLSRTTRWWVTLKARK